MSTEVGFWEGLLSAVADTIWEVGGGRLLTRLTAAGATGDTTITVTATDRFPATGDLVLDGTVYAYTSKTSTTFAGLVQRLSPQTLSGTTGLARDSLPLAAVMDDSQSETQLDKLRASFMRLRAADSDLDVLGRNYGVPHPRGLGYDDYRDLLGVLIAVEAQTMYCFEKVLDVLHGPGSYDLYENAITAEGRHKVFVGIPGSGSTITEGKAFLSGNEAATRDTVTTVTTSTPGLLAYGVYDSTDPYRVGDNYAMQPYGASAGFTTSGFPRVLQDTTNSPFVAGDLGKPVIMEMPSGERQHWRITLVGASAVQLAWTAQSDGRVGSGALDRFVTDSPWFPEWVATGGTEETQITIATGPNAGSYQITGWISPYEVEVTPSFAETETDISWVLEPNYGANTISGYSVFRGSVSGTTVTTPRTMPSDVLVDYTSVESAQAVVDSSTNGEAQKPFYLYDFGALTREILDLLTAAGVTVETEIT